MHVALIREPESTNGHTWEHILSSTGHSVYIIESIHDNIPAKLLDVCLPLTTVHDFIYRANRRYDMAIAYEASGVRMVNNCNAIDASSNKLTSYEIWQKAGISQPVTYSLSDATTDFKNITFPAILKPALGHSGEYIYLVHSLSEAHAQAKTLEGHCLLQEYIPSARSIRVIASKHTTFACYERILPGAIAANVSQGATRHYFTPSDELTKLAKQMVATLDGGLMGVDILEKGGKYYALEANVPFGFDAANHQLHTQLVSYINSFED